MLILRLLIGMDYRFWESIFACKGKYFLLSWMGCFCYYRWYIFMLYYVCSCQTVFFLDVTCNVVFFTEGTLVVVLFGTVLVG